ncbi:hypothetical protein KAR91_18480, partial [Candidatus Pacearchaeota archaeon]|nr:hypothetical protein [Candidatus Pacearchaeota archaeon]
TYQQNQTGLKSCDIDDISSLAQPLVFSIFLRFIERLTLFKIHVFNVLFLEDTFIPKCFYFLYRYYWQAFLSLTTFHQKNS